MRSIKYAFCTLSLFTLAGCGNSAPQPSGPATADQQKAAEAEQKAVEDAEKAQAKKEAAAAKAAK